MTAGSSVRGTTGRGRSSRPWSAADPEGTCPVLSGTPARLERMAACVGSALGAPLGTAVGGASPGEASAAPAAPAAAPPAAATAPRGAAWGAAPPERASKGTTDSHWRRVDDRERRAWDPGTRRSLLPQPDQVVVVAAPPCVFLPEPMSISRYMVVTGTFSVYMGLDGATAIDDDADAARGADGAAVEEKEPR